MDLLGAGKAKITRAWDSFSKAGLQERGFAVAAGLGLDSMAVDRFFQSAAGKLSGQTGLLFAAQGSRVERGILLWERGGLPQQFTFPMNPESISEEVAPDYAEIKVPGQNRPMYQFINGGARSVSFTLNFFYQERRRDAIANQIDALKELTQRSYTGRLEGAYDGPPTLQFIFGAYFTGRERFIVSKLAIKSFDLFDPTFLLPMRADVEVSLLEVIPVSRRATNRVLGFGSAVRG